MRSRVGDAGHIPELVEVSRRDAERLRAVIGEVYGFTPTLAYCRDLAAFVDKMSNGGAAAPQKEIDHETK